MNFKNWVQYREKCIEVDLYTKTHLREMRLKPKKDAIPQVGSVYTGGRWREFYFYKIEDTQPIKTKKKSKVRDLPMTLENICKSLYVIIKSAKKSRDSKQINYYSGNYGIVNRCKERQEDLYDIKNRVMQCLISNNKLILEGYHIQKINTMNIYLLLYRYKNYSYHIISSKDEIKGLKFLGIINNCITSDSKNNGIKFNEATKILSEYLDNEKLDKAI